MLSENITTTSGGGRERAHALFIQHYLRTNDKRLAYKTAYPDIADGDSLRVASNRLFRQLKPEIEKLEARATELAISEMMQDAKERIKSEICAMQQRREVLADMILGRMKIKRHIKLKDQIVEVEDDVSPYAIIRAIDLDSKLAANIYREKIIPPVEKKIPGVAIGMPEVADMPQPQSLDVQLKEHPFGDPYWKGTKIELSQQDIEKYGFDILDEGIPYLDGELTEEFKQQRIQKDIEYFKLHYPDEAKECFDSPTLCTSTEKKQKETNEQEDESQAEAQDLWTVYLSLDSNTRALHHQDRKQKETWFRAIPRKQQLRLIELYRKTG